MNKASEDRILKFLENKYKGSFLCLKGDNYKIISVKTKRTKEGIDSIHCFTFFTVNGYMYKNQGIPAMPYTLFPVISKCKIHQYYPEINAIAVTLWFKQPLVAEVLETLDKKLSTPMK